MENRKSKHNIRRISSFKTETLQSYQKSYNEWVILKKFLIIVFTTSIKNLMLKV